MFKYELVCVIDAGLASADIQKLREKIEGMVTVLETDEIGLLPTVYPIFGQDQAYYVSYCIEMDPDTMDGVKQKMKLEKGLARYVFYKMKGDQKFLKFGELQKVYSDIKEAELEALEGNKSEESLSDEEVVAESVEESKE